MLSREQPHPENCMHATHWHLSRRGMVKNLTMEKLGARALLCQKLRVGTVFNNFAIRYHCNRVCVPNGAQLMDDHSSSATLTCSPKRVKYNSC